MTKAEELLDIADSLGGPRLFVLVEDCAGCSTDDINRMGSTIKLALTLKKNPVLALRAIVEEWTGQQIVRELY